MFLPSGICICGGKLIHSSWETKTEKKERSTCNACGRTELLAQPQIKPTNGD